MNLRDMLNSIEEAPSSQSLRVARATDQNAQVAQRSHDAISKRTDVTSKNVSKQLAVYDFMASDEFSQASAFASMVEKAKKEMLSATPNTEIDPSLLQQSAIPELELEEALSMDIPINVLSNIMDNDQDVPLIRQGLRQIQNERGINKRFMPAMKQFLAPYIDVLSSGFTGWNQISALRKALAGQDKIEQPANDQDQGNQQQQAVEPTEDEIRQFAQENGINVTTEEQMEKVKEIMMQQDAQNNDANADNNQEQPDMKDQKLAASKYSEGTDNEPLHGAEELKRLSEIVEAMSDIYSDQDQGSSEQVEGSVEFKQHKNTDKGSVSIEASADDMQELSKVLKLAGLTLPSDMNADEDPIQPEKHDDEEDHDEPENHDDHDEPEAPCDAEPEDGKAMVIAPSSYETDKEVLVNYLKDKLKKSIS